MKLRTGDTVHIQVGKDKGKSGKILKVHPSDNRILVEGINVYKKHSKPKKQGESGEIVSLPRAFPASKALLFCAKCKRGVRVGIRRDGTKRDRYCKRCKATL